MPSTLKAPSRPLSQQLVQLPAPLMHWPRSTAAAHSFKCLSRHFALEAHLAPIPRAHLASRRSACAMQLLSATRQPKLQSQTGSQHCRRPAATILPANSTCSSRDIRSTRGGQAGASCAEEQDTLRDGVLDDGALLDVACLFGCRLGRWFWVRGACWRRRGSRAKNNDEQRYEHAARGLKGLEAVHVDLHLLRHSLRHSARK